MFKRTASVLLESIFFKFWSITKISEILSISLILNLFLTATVLVLAFKRRDLPCYKGFCFPWLKVMPLHAVLLFLNLNHLRAFILKQMFWFIEDLVFADYVRMLFLQLLQSFKSRVGFCKTVIIPR